jgi:hypothetical protein
MGGLLIGGFLMGLLIGLDGLLIGGLLMGLLIGLDGLLIGGLFIGLFIVLFIDLFLGFLGPPRAKRG